MVDAGKRSSLRTALGYLRRMMEGEELSISKILETEEEASDSTIRRYLIYLEEALPEVKRSDSRPATWNFEWPVGIATSPFTLQTLQVAHSMLSELRGSVFDNELENLAAQLGSKLGEGKRVTDPSRMFFTKTKVLNRLTLSPDVVNNVTQAITQCRRSTAVYESFDGFAREIKIEPYTLLFTDSGTYCYGLCLESVEPRHEGKGRVYNLARFRWFQATKESFDYPEVTDYDPEKLFGDCFGIILPEDPKAQPERVVLRFAQRWGHYLKTHQWHKSQSNPKVLPDGKWEVSFYVHLTFDFERWVRGLGGEVAVVEPKTLKERVLS